MKKNCWFVFSLVFLISCGQAEASSPSPEQRERVFQGGCVGVQEVFEGGKYLFDPVVYETNDWGAGFLSPAFAENDGTALDPATALFRDYDEFVTALPPVRMGDDAKQKMNAGFLRRYDAAFFQTYALGLFQTVFPSTAFSVSPGEYAVGSNEITLSWYLYSPEQRSGALPHYWAISITCFFFYPIPRSSLNFDVSYAVNDRRITYSSKIF